MGQYTSKVLKQEQITSDIFRLTLDAPEIARVAQPGQFVHLRVSETTPLLRRPFSIHRIEPSQGRIELLYRVIGQGTALMARAETNHVMDVMGPLGNGFDLDRPFEEAVIVAGGMGSAPVFSLMDALIPMGKKIVLLWGARIQDEFFHLNQLTNMGIDVRLATDDGSKGHHGFVTDLLRNSLAESNPSESAGFVCGPHAMLEQVQKMIMDSEMDWQVSMEEHMACGIGVCQGCAVQIGGRIQMVCSEGPVFDLKEVAFDG